MCFHRLNLIFREIMLVKVNSTESNTIAKPCDNNKNVFVFLPLKLEVTFPCSKSKKKSKGNSKNCSKLKIKSSKSFIAEET